MKITQLTKRVLLPLLMGSMLHAASDTSSTNESLRTLPSDYNMIVALYGRPHSKALGTLGKQPLVQTIKMAKEKAKLYEFIENFKIDMLIAENALTIPLHVPLGLALTEIIAETQIPTIAHHHDFYWERVRFTVNYDFATIQSYSAKRN